MKNMLAVAVLLSLAAPSFGQDGQNGCIPSYAFGKKYSSDISPKQLAKTPSWDMKSDSPPFPLGKAIRLANVLKAKLAKDSKEYKWYLMSATLERLHPPLWDDDPKMRDKCWWSVRYEAHVREGGENGQPDYLIIVVLMDGTVIDPKVSDWKE